MSWGFYQFPLEKGIQNYTAFSTPFGSFKWLVMPMGVTGSPPVFQSLMNDGKSLGRPYVEKHNSVPR